MRFAIVTSAGAIRDIINVPNQMSADQQTVSGATAVRCENLAVTADSWQYKNSKFVQIFSTRSPAEVEAALLVSVDSTRESLQMMYLTPGGAKKMIYNSKQDEARDFASLGSAVVAALNSLAIATRFPYAATEMALSGETLTQVMNRTKASIDANLLEVQRFEAIAQVGKRRIKAATTAATKQAAFDAINWDWRKT